MVFRKRVQFHEANRLVIKVGTSTITHTSTGRPHLEKIEKIVRQLVDLKNEGREVVLVTSGAIGAGMGVLGFKERPKRIPDQQAAAAIGQGVLMQIYSRFFRQYQCEVAQILLTREAVVRRRSYLNACNTMATLLGEGIIPIVNENDTVAVDEIKFGDNDTLSALVASMVDADLLIILSDIDGLYTADPASVPGAELISEVEEITHEIVGVAGDSRYGTGGMKTKITAARIATTSGIAMVIVNGSEEGVIPRVVSGQKVGTFFHPSSDNLSKRKQWIAFHLKTEGKVFVDTGAKSAIQNQGTSLLPGGVTGVRGTFLSGDLVSVCDEQEKEFARGLVNYSSEDIREIRGLHSSRISDVLDQDGPEEVVHRDNLVLLPDNGSICEEQ